jgi:L-arabinose isomerase
MQKTNLKIGLFGIGLEAYWEQFTGLKDRLEGHLKVVQDKLAAMHPAIVNLGLIDNSEKAFAAGHAFRREDVDLIFLYVSTYALSSTVLPVVQRAKVPVIILNLAPEAAIDYATFNKMNDRTNMTGEWLAFCTACPVPEIANVFIRTGIKFYQITGMLHNDEACWTEVREWVDAARVASIMFHNRLGCMGHYYSGMLDIYSDLTQQYAHFGGHIELIEVDELAMLRKKVSDTQIEERVTCFKEIFAVQPDVSEEELQRAARTSVALDQLVDKYQLGSMAYYYKGTGNYFFFQFAAFTVTGIAFLTHFLAFAIAGRAGICRHHLAQHGIYYFTHLSGPLAGSTGLQRRTVFRSVTAAHVTGNVTFHFYFLFYAVGYFFQIQL